MIYFKSSLLKFIKSRNALNELLDYLTNTNMIDTVLAVEQSVRILDFIIAELSKPDAI